MCLGASLIINLQGWAMPCMYSKELENEAGADVAEQVGGEQKEGAAGQHSQAGRSREDLRAGGAGASGSRLLAIDREGGPHPDPYSSSSARRYSPQSAWWNTTIALGSAARQSEVDLAVTPKPSGTSAADLRGGGGGGGPRRGGLV